MSDFNDFKNIKTPTEWKERLYARTAEQSVSSARRRRLPLTATAVLVLIAILSTSALAVSLVGGDFFRQLFINQVKSTDSVYDYMNVDQLRAIAGTTTGTVVDTDELKIEVMDVISSGNMAMVMLRVTAKELQSVIFDTGYETLMNYRFGSDTDGNLFKNMEQISIRYYYSDDDPTLENNQFEILYTIINHQVFEAGTYTIELKDFGYYVSNGTSLVLEPLHKGKWEFEVELADGNEYSHAVLLRQPVTVEGYNIMLEDIRITPMSSTIVFSYNSKDDLSAVYNAFSSNMGNLGIILSDGTVLTEEDFSYVVMSGSDGAGHPISAIVINLSFNLPISAESIREFSIFNETFSIPNSESILLP
ncbi:hypothetical protein NE686_03085 [Tissierella carlieri]|uniref:DUF4179 domain-containing protein n=1 Tax=Tissierella carlieri TaxID=689904 RepID=A0ABT1S6T5_9FIRM|nr:hypothetical protein [Tissierella carlieri]MCQ4922057.1 hypothetical protein [Tissierella carlieri]